MPVGKQIHRIRIKPRTKEWLDWRFEHGIGGSEISSVVATRSKVIAELTYTSPIKFFLSKIGEPIQEFLGNVESESGIYFEKIIQQWYKHYDIDNSADLRLAQMAMFDNIKKGNRINKLVSPGVFFVNEKYPWLFYSPDGIATRPNGIKVLQETKNTTSMTARRFTNNVDPAYYLQVQQGLLITELECADLCILIDGRWFSVVTIEPNKEIHDLILEASHEMWQKVLTARKIKEEYELPAYLGINPEKLTPRQIEGVQILTDMEPDITGTDEELQLFKEMIVPSEEDNPMEGTPAQLAMCEKYNALKDDKDQVEIKRKELYIELIRSLEGRNKAIFNDNTYFSYKADKNGNRSIYVSPKILKSDALSN